MTDFVPTPGLTEEQVSSLLLDSEPYLSCSDCFDQLDVYVESLVAKAGHRDEPMQVHLAACGACADEAKTLLEFVTSRG